MNKFYLECRIIKCQYSSSPKESSSKMSQFQQQTDEEHEHEQQVPFSPTERYCQDKDHHFFEQLNKWMEKERVAEEQEEQIIHNHQLLKGNLKEGQNKRASCGLVVNNICYNCGSFTCHCHISTDDGHGQGHNTRSSKNQDQPGSELDKSSTRVGATKTKASIIMSKSGKKYSEDRSQKVLLPRAQSSRSLLNQRQIVRSKREEWEQFAKEQREIDERYFCKRPAVAAGDHQDRSRLRAHWTKSLHKDTQTDKEFIKGQLNGSQKGQKGQQNQKQNINKKLFVRSESESLSESKKTTVDDSSSSRRRVQKLVKNQNKKSEIEKFEKSPAPAAAPRIPSQIQSPPRPRPSPSTTSAAISSRSRVVTNHGFKQQVGQLHTINHHRKSIDGPAPASAAERDFNSIPQPPPLDVESTSKSKAIAMTLDRNAGLERREHTTDGNGEEVGLDEFLQVLKNEYDSLKIIKNQPKIWDVRKSKEQISTISSPPPPSSPSRDTVAVIKKKSRGSLVVIHGPNSTRSQSSTTDGGGKSNKDSSSSRHPPPLAEGDEGFKWTITSLTRKVSEMKLKMDHQRDQLTCHKCQEPFGKGELAIQNPDGSKYWHVGHLSCKICHKGFTSGECFFHDGEGFCDEHYSLMAQIPRCQNPRCLKFIYDEKYTLASNKTYHSRCFTCSKCRNQIIDAKYVSFRDQVYCFPCHQKEFNHVCSTCQQNIKPSESFVQSSSQDPESNLFWHASKFCLRCQTCGKNLIGRSQLFVNKDGSLYCNRYCAQRKIPPV